LPRSSMSGMATCHVYLYPGSSVQMSEPARRQPQGAGHVRKSLM
jgi:hypothetical protein